ncbi:hypothetical protein A9Q84_09215 [Halobacteriovorax marinus]|uniref:PilZ domain-containing protein n=1 Tax=Halobacteriovorax marinus TaxID=97084 RepID=A0A1Y5F6J1_9BACT|nr:hypothetical protein A9Q84_09215 [Halobacteriovorax marinus]
MWQTLEGDEDKTRDIRIGTMFKVNPKEGSFSVRAKDANFSFFNKKLTVYIRGEFESILFKCSGENFGDKFGNFNIPLEMMILEKREFPRVSLSDKKLMKLKSGDKEISLRVLDISCGGACLLISEKSAEFLKKFKKFEAVSINETLDFVKTTGVIVHSQALPGANSERSMRVGIKFSKAQDEYFLRQFT